jgi:anaerobic magnesium-protoporphyrin IX monomethyl ester cyclase
MDSDSMPSILLINPFYPIDETPSPPLGLAFLAGALERAGFQVKILDFVVFPYSQTYLTRIIDALRPIMVGVTSVTMTFDTAMEILGDVKKIHEDIITVMGGPHISFCSENTLRQYPCLDIAVLGEGEATIVELGQALTTVSDLSEIPGIVFRRGMQIVNTGWRKTALDVDALALPARHLIPLGRYRALNMPISMTTSRGCPFGCIFCVGRKMVGPKIRYRDPVRVVDELRDLVDLGFAQVNLADDLFTAREDHCLAVCDEIIKRKLKIKWTSFARVDTVSLKMLARMKNAGCQAVSFGVETGNPQILKTIRKGITLEQVVDAVKMCNQAGLLPHASFILGLPGETPETVDETVRFGKKLEAMGVSYGFHLLAPFPGTEVREKSEMYGLHILTDDWRQYHANSAIVETGSVKKEMLDTIVKGWKDRFDSWLGEIENQMKTGSARPSDAMQLINLKRTVLIYDLMMEGTLEKMGSWKSDSLPDSDGKALEELCRRIRPETKYSHSELLETLGHALASKNLTYTAGIRGTTWQWVDSLERNHSRG